MPQSGPSDVLVLPRRIWWPWDDPADRVGFWRTFLAHRAEQAQIYVSASGPYAAWLDRRRLPVADSYLPSWRAMHCLPVALQAGEHTLYILAEPGDHGQPFLLACLDWQEVEGGLCRVATGQDWLMVADPSSGWPASTDNSEGHPAWAFDGVWAEPWGMPCNAPPDFCRLSTGWQQMRAERLSQVAELHQGLASAGASIQAQDDGAIEMHPVRPFPSAPPHIENTRPRSMWHLVREVHSQITNSWLDVFAARAPRVVLDAECETFARVCVRLRSGGPAILALTTGESLPETHRYDRRITDVFELCDGETFTTSPTGFRYVRTAALSAGHSAVVLDPIEVQHIRCPVEQVGQFACSDPTLDEIWALCARTTHLCMQNEIWDGIKRDQLPWMGDLYVEALAAYHLYGDARLARRTLAVLSEMGPAPARPLREQRCPGLQAIWRTPGGDINGIPSYTMWWIVGLADYVQYTGDRSLIDELADELVATLEHMARHLDQAGLWRPSGTTTMIDWAPVPAAERERFCHLLACHAVSLGRAMLHDIDRTDQAQLYDETHARMATAARQAWWSGDASGWDLGVSHHVHAMAIRSGVLSPNEAARHFAQTLASDPPFSMTYWHRYADLDAAARVGEVTWGVDYIRRHWGPALQVGMTTLWEAFDPAWIGDDPHAASLIGDEHAAYGGYRTSLCHAWSAGPAVWLHRAVLGISPTRPGFAAVRFSPSLGDLDWAEGTIPTPHGPIQVSLSRKEGALPRAEVTAPAGIEVQIPRAVQDAWEIAFRTAQQKEEQG